MRDVQKSRPFGERPLENDLKAPDFGRRVVSLAGSGMAERVKSQKQRGEGDSTSTIEAPPLNPLRLVLSTFGVLFGVGVLAWTLAYFFRETLLSLSAWFVDSFGGPGIAVGFFIPDAFTIPLPNDMFSFFGVMGGIGFLEVVFWGSLGSLLGGSTGWMIGRWCISDRPVLRRFIERKGGDEIERQLQRHGAVFLAIAAITPLPYSVVCWAAGASKMPYRRFIAISLLRIPRVSFYLWLLQIGVLQVVG